MASAMRAVSRSASVDWKPAQRLHCASTARPSPKSRKSKPESDICGREAYPAPHGPCRPLALISMSIYYRGRFAPSPTGPLHFGSLFAAVISYLHAKANDGIWLVRIEDLDPPRESPAAKSAILETLHAHGLHSDEPILLQSERSAYYEQCLERIRQKGLSFRCSCSRQQLSQSNGQHSPACLAQHVAEPYAIRFRSHQERYIWNDLFLGQQALIIREDFVLKRKEGLYAYQLAVVCDDIAQGITHVIRGSDLLDSTPMQLALYRALDHQPPQFGHFPVIVDDSGQKLSKQAYAPAVNNALARQNLLDILTLLHLNIAEPEASPRELLRQAALKWRDDLIQPVMSLPEPSL